MQNNPNNDNYISDYKNLVDFSSGQFGKINEKFEVINKKFEVINEKFDAIDKRFDAIDERLDQKADKSDIDLVLTRVNLISNKLDDYRAEQIGMQHQLDKHEKWHSQTAEKIGIKLSA
jgi:hypothetical protein